MVRLGELMMILELHRQGVSITAIARRTGRDPKTIRKYIERGVEAPAYGPRRAGRPSKLAAYLDFLRERRRVAANQLLRRRTQLPGRHAAATSAWPREH
jgi:transposase